MLKKTPVIILILCVLGCVTATSKGPVEGRVNHIVLCWLKEPGNADHRQRVIETSESFRQIPGVLEVRVGQVVLSDRTIVDDSFDVGMCIAFSTVDAMTAYINHPTHKKAVDEVLVPLVRKTVVHDFVE